MMPAYPTHLIQFKSVRGGSRGGTLLLVMQRPQNTFEAFSRYYVILSKQKCNMGFFISGLC